MAPDLPQPEQLEVIDQEGADEQRDSRHESRYIATIPGLGYRFVAEVRTSLFGEAERAAGVRGQPRPVAGVGVARSENGWAGGPESEGAGAGVAERFVSANGGVSSGVVEPSRPPAPARGESPIASLKHHREFAAAAVALLLVGASAVAFWAYRHAGDGPAEATAASEIEVTPLTRTGTTRVAAISPDGKYILYSAAEAGRESLWLRQATASSAQQIVAPARAEYHGLTFSRDGGHVYFVRSETNGSARALYRMPALGGVATKLLDGVHSPVTLSPDGGRLAFVRNSGGESALMIAGADGGGQRRLAARPMTDHFKVPAWSPDGKLIACFRRDEAAGDELRVVAVPFDGGAPERAFAVPPDITPMPFVRWSPDGQALTYTAHRDGISNIWAQPLGGGPAKQLTEFKVEGRLRFDWSRDGRQLVLSRHIWTSDLVLLRNFKPGRAS